MIILVGLNACTKDHFTPSVEAESVGNVLEDGTEEINLGVIDREEAIDWVGFDWIATSQVQVQYLLYNVANGELVYRTTWPTGQKDGRANPNIPQNISVRAALRVKRFNSSTHRITVDWFLSRKDPVENCELGPFRGTVNVYAPAETPWEDIAETTMHKKLYHPDCQ